MTTALATGASLDALQAFLAGERGRGALDELVGHCLGAYVTRLRDCLNDGSMSSGQVAAVALGVRMAVPSLPPVPPSLAGYCDARR